jgi:hypothetical protein
MNCYRFRAALMRLPPLLAPLNSASSDYPNKSLRRLTALSGESCQISLKALPMIDIHQ